MKNLTDIITLIILVGPITLQLAKNIAQHTHSKRMENLVNRASIIVGALDRQNIANDAKKAEAVSALAGYANEAGIKVTPTQLSQYIENAVALMRTADQALTASDSIKLVTPIQTADMVPPIKETIHNPVPPIKEEASNTVGGDPDANKEEKQ